MYKKGSMNFGQKLKDIRKSSNLSQQDMSEILFTTQGNYSLYETNIRKPSIDFKIRTDYKC